jgi:hypothetical protein
VLYPFGFGLSYSSFRVHVAAADLVKTVVSATQMQVHFDVSVANVGPRASDYVMLVFDTTTSGSATHGNRLVAFQRLHDVSPGAVSNLRLSVDQEVRKHRSGLR